MFKESLLQSWRPYVLIIILGALVYFQTTGFEFVDYDDTHLIVTNNSFLSDLSNVPQVFVKDVFDVEFFQSSKSYYRPFMTLSLMIDASLGKTEPFVYHVSNILIHLIASCLLFYFFVQYGFRKDLSLLFSMIYVIHPALTQAVAWIPGRNDSLLTLFALLSFILFHSYLVSQKAKHLFLHILFLLSALYVKETAVGIVLLCLFYILFVNKIKVIKSQMAFISAGWATAVAAWFIPRSLVITNPDITIGHIFNSLIINSPGLIQYAGKVLFPVNLSVYPIMKDMPLIYGIAGTAMLILLLAFSKKRSTSMALFGLSWFVLFLLPGLISKTPGPETMFLEHRLHLPIIGFMIMLLETDLVKKLSVENRASSLLAIAVVPVLAFTSFNHSGAMKNPYQYWLNAAHTSPNSSVAHLNLGDKYYAKKMLDEAEKSFKKSIELKPDQKMAHNNLGMVYAVKGRMDKAEKEFMEELKLNPAYDNALYNLGMLNYDRKNFADAVNYWEKTVRVKPWHIKANRMLAYYYYQTGSREQAQEHLDRLIERGVKINPAHFRGLKTIKQ